MVELLALLLTLLVFTVPGIFLSFALFSGTKFNKLDKFLAGFVLSLAIFPLLSFIENFFFGLLFSTWLVLFNVLLLFVIGIYLLYTKSLLNLNSVGAVLNKEIVKASKKPILWLVPVLLLAILFVGFYFRVAYSLSTNFFEFDPYYYASLVETLTMQGSIPFSSDLSYFPFEKFHHEPPLMAFLTGGWYLVYNFFSGLTFDKNSLILIVNFYPPVVGAFLSLLIFWLLRAHYHEVAGLAGAALMASTPMLLQKFAAGVAELQPWGIFTAVFMFAAYLLALKYKQWQFIALAGLATVCALLGAAQYVWPIGVMAAFFLIQTFVNYYAKHDDFEFIISAVVFAVSSIIGSILLNAYTNTPLFSFSTAVWIAILSALPAVFLFYINKLQQLAKYSRAKILAVILVVAFIFSLLPVFSGGASVFSVGASFIGGVSSIAKTGSPLGKTIAEESPTGFAENPAVFGLLSPLILAILAAFLAWSAVERLLVKKHVKYAGILVLFSILIVVFRTQIASFLDLLGTSIGFTLLEVTGHLWSSNELFSYLVISVISTIIAFIHSEPEQRSEAGLLVSFILYPVAYIGLNKVKFLVHFGVALAAGAGTLVGEIYARAAFLFEYLKFGENSENAKRWTLNLAIILALLLTTIQAVGFQDKSPGIINSVAGLQYSKISQDWLDAMSWLRNNTNYNNPADQARCIGKYGYDCRVMSWWDYGHWTVFLGETKTVLDPGNAFPGFDQEVAYGFVDNQTAFLKSMEYHGASHILVDFQLIEKWGALVFLSGSCQRKLPGSDAIYALTCPAEPQITDWQSGAGGHPYELDHYFERLEVKGECPYARGMILIQSNFGAVYCASQSELIPIDQSGLRTDFARVFEVIDIRKKVENIDPNKHYLIPLSESVLVDANPDLRIIGRESKVVNSTFVRLYVFENLPGFNLVYRSTNGEVKIFEKVN